MFDPPNNSVYNQQKRLPSPGTRSPSSDPKIQSSECPVLADWSQSVLGLGAVLQLLGPRLEKRFPGSRAAPVLRSWIRGLSPVSSPAADGQPRVGNLRSL